MNTDRAAADAELIADVGGERAQRGRFELVERGQSGEHREGVGPSSAKRVAQAQLVAADAGEHLLRQLVLGGVGCLAGGLELEDRSRQGTGVGSHVGHDGSIRLDG